VRRRRHSSRTRPTTSFQSSELLGDRHQGGLKRLDLFAPYDDFMHRGIVGNDFEILPIEPRHTSILTTLPPHHKDRFDRLLVAQALVEGIPIVSVDVALDPYGVTRRW
jgi:PIN domain nuclease of toxin-antitoxin system